MVISIIGILAALLLPALQGARASASQAKCTSNIRQLAMAAQMYWDEHDGESFKYRGATTNNGDIYWFGWLERGTEGSRVFDPTLGALYPYLQSRGVEVCPSLNYASSRLKKKASGAAYGYGYNYYLSGASTAPPVVIPNLRRPGQTALFADSAQVNTFQAPASADRPMIEEFYYISTNRAEATVHFRHKHRANVVFCDGHVERETPAPGSLDSRMPDQWIGRLRPECFGAP